MNKTNVFMLKQISNLYLKLAKVDCHRPLLFANMDSKYSAYTQYHFFLLQAVINSVSSAAEQT